MRKNTFREQCLKIFINDERRASFFTVSNDVPLRRSYGSVYKALHKESGQVLAIKQVPVDTDLQEIIKEISIMQQCDSPYVVKYYGSYFKNTDLWVSRWNAAFHISSEQKLGDFVNIVVTCRL